MKTHQCCGWDIVSHMVIYTEWSNSNRVQVYPCECCSNDIEFVDNCTKHGDNPNTEYVCRSDNKEFINNFVNRTCNKLIAKEFVEDLDWMIGLMILVMIVTAVSIVISIRLSTFLLDLYNSND